MTYIEISRDCPYISESVSCKKYQGVKWKLSNFTGLQNGMKAML